MRHCARHEDDLALFAGGDLAGCEEERSLAEHLTACEGCRGFLAELQGDLVALGGLAEDVAEEGDSLASDVLLRLAATERSVRDEPTDRRAPMGSDRRAPMGSNLRAAAALLVVATAFAGALALQGPARTADGVDGVPSLGEVARGAAGPVDGLPIRIRRSGSGLELEWTGDGREQVVAGPATTYRVVASAFANDFDEGRSVEVAGEHLVASGLPFPARRMRDRDLTFFRVE